MERLTFIAKICCVVYGTPQYLSVRLSCNIHCHIISLARYVVLVFIYVTYICYWWCGKYTNDLTDHTYCKQYEAHYKDKCINTDADDFSTCHL